MCVRIDGKFYILLFCSFHIPAANIKKINATKKYYLQSKSNLVGWALISIATPSFLAQSKISSRSAV